jgi:hypothetical protein
VRLPAPKTVVPSDWIDVKAPRITPIYAPPAELIWIEQEQLLWKPSRAKPFPDGSLLRQVVPERDVFLKFLLLANAPVEKILSFAKRNGVLGLCQHGLPFCHAPRAVHQERSPQSPYCKYKSYGRIPNDTVVEPLASWRALAFEASALLTIKSRSLDMAGAPILSKEELRARWTEAVWLCTQQYFNGRHLRYRALRDDPIPSASRMRTRLDGIANEWLRCGLVQARLQWAEPAHRFTLEADSEFGPNLFGFLAVQLAVALSGVDTFAICAGCKRFFQPMVNTISQTRRAYCEDCQKTTRQSDATRAWRKRKKMAQQLWAEGATIFSIAKRLKITKERVEKLVGIPLPDPDRVARP